MTNLPLDNDQATQDANPESSQNDNAAYNGNQDMSSTIQGTLDGRPPSSYGAMKPHHVTMITIGGAIHTGLMIGAGSVLTDAGPAPIIISYTFVGLIVYLVLCALGEVASWSPVPSTLDGHAVRFCDPALGFTLGWIYWLKYVVVIPSQLTAAALLISLWLDPEQVNPGVWVTAFLAIIVTANYSVGAFLGAYDVVLAFLKILIVLGLIVLSIILAIRSDPGFHQRLLFWGDSDVYGDNHGGAGLLGKFGAICETLPSATYAYLGSEMIGMTILQTEDPCTTTARAIKMTSYRIVMFNIVSTVLVAMLIPTGLMHLEKDGEDSQRTLSAFVVAIQMAHIPVLPHILNACILLFAVSSATCGLHMAIGTMYRMSLNQRAPSCLSYTDRRGTPVNALCLCSGMATLAYLNISGDSKVLFGYFVNMVTMFSILTWISILITHLSFVRARRAQKVPDTVLAFKAPLGRFGSWFALVSCIIISLLRIVDIIDHFGNRPGADYTAFITSYLGVPLYSALLVGYKTATKCRRVDPAEAGLFSHLTVLDSSGPGSLHVDAQKAFGRHKQRVKGFMRLWVL